MSRLSILRADATHNCVNRVLLIDRARKNWGKIVDWVEPNPFLCFPARNFFLFSYQWHSAKCLASLKFRLLKLYMKGDPTFECDDIHMFADWECAQSFFFSSRYPLWFLLFLMEKKRVHTALRALATAQERLKCMGTEIKVVLGNADTSMVMDAKTDTEMKAEAEKDIDAVKDMEEAKSPPHLQKSIRRDQGRTTQSWAFPSNQNFHRVLKFLLFTVNEVLHQCGKYLK